MEMTGKLIHIVVNILLLFFAACAVWADGSKPLLFVGDIDYPPYEYLKNGAPNGFYIDVTNELARVMGQNIQIRLMDWEKAQQMVLSGEADALIGISVSEQRKALYDFCDTTISVEFSLFLREGTVGVKTIDDLNGKVIGVTRGGYPRQTLKANDQITIMAVDTYLDGFHLLKDGVISAFVADKWVGAYHLQKNNIRGINIEEEPFAVRDNTFAVRKGNKELLLKINGGLRALTAQEMLPRIQQKWMRQKVIYATEEYVQNMLWILIAGVIALLVFGGGISIVARTRQAGKRRLMESALQESEMRYRSMVETMTEAFALHEMIFDKNSRPMDYKFLEVNAAFERLTHLKRRDIIGKSVKEVLPQIENIWIETYGQIVKTGQSNHFEQYAAPLKRHYEVFAYRTAPGQFATFFIDITDRKKAEEKLVLSEKRYHELFKQTSKCIIVYAPLESAGDFIIVDINETAENIEKIDRRDVLNKSVFKAFPEMLQMGVVDVMKRVLATGVAETCPIAIHLSGRIVTWCEYYIYKLPSGEIVTVYEYISEQNKIREELRLAEQKFTKAFQNAPIMFAILEPDSGVHIDVNEAMIRGSGFSREELIGHSAVEIGWLSLENWQGFLKEIGKHGRLSNAEMDFRAKDGGAITCLIGGERIPIANREYLLVLAADITGRKQAEESLREAENKLQLSFENANIGVCFIDLSGCFLRVNREMTHILSYTRDELESMCVNDITYPEDWSLSPSVIKKALEGRETQTVYNKRYVHKDGRVIHCRVSSSLIKDSGGKPLYFISHVQDISQQLKMEERLQRAEKMEALGLLAGGVAHDLNNVIGISIGYAEMLLEDMEPDSPLRTHVINIMQATQRATAIVQDMLTIARRGVAASRVININTLIENMVKSPVLSGILAMNPNIEIKTSMDDPLLNINGSPIHLEKTLMNLISNAAEAIHDGGVIRIESKNVHLDRPVKGYDSFEEGDYVVLSVSDTGEGIPAENLPHIFEPFYTKKVMGRSGTGLGLAVVWGAVKDHKGYIDVTSEAGRGTTFSLYFPVCRDEVEAAPEVISRAAYMGKGESILVVDDMPEQRELAVRILGKLNYLSTSAGSGEEAVAFIKNSKADLVLLDMIMDPGIDGLETYKRMIEFRPGQRAIIVSGFAETNRVAEAQALGVGAYVRKPYIMETLGLAVRRELDKIPQDEAGNIQKR